MFEYNFVVLNTVDNKFKIDHDAYYTICLEDLYLLPNVNVVSCPLDYASTFVRFLFNLHHSVKINRIINLPLKYMWYPFYFKDSFEDKKPFCFILIDRKYSVDYLHYLKQTYKNCKIVLLHRDLRFVCEKLNPQLLTCKEVDLQMTFDKGESIKYNMPHFDEFESKIEVPICDNYPESDVFFAGRVKNRFDKLMSIYQILSNKGVKCKYFLIGVEPSKRVTLPGITYADKFMTYKEMLFHSVNSRCILDINQENADGYTSRFLEAVMFNKLLLTDNQSVKDSKFYSDKFIQIIDDYDKIDADFIKKDSIVDYHYSGEFSPIHLLQQIQAILADR